MRANDTTQRNGNGMNADEAEAIPTAQTDLLPPYCPPRAGMIGEFARHPCTWMLLGFAGGVALTLWLTEKRK